MSPYQEFQGRSVWYVLDGHEPVPATSEQASALMLDITKRRVAHDIFGDVTISTVFVCLDHSTSEDNRPMLFETMIFGGKHDQYQTRCSTWAEAEAAHADAVALVKH
jgi:hypothetical protein